MAELITMSSRELSRYEILSNLIRGHTNGTEASKQLGLSVRHTRRLKTKAKKYGAKGLIHGNRGKPSNREMPKEKRNKIRNLIRKSYPDFGPTFAAEKLEEEHGIRIGVETLRQDMIIWSFWRPRPRKGNKEYRSWRPRKEYYGEMEQFDGSYHEWFEDRAPRCCLLASIDDATGKITGLRFVHDEGTIPVFRFWKKYIEERGKPLSIYLDRYSTYKKNQKTVFDDPEALTQFERAMRDLDIRVIHAHSPQAKGRAERLFETLQDRLVKELRLQGISTVEEASRFAEEVFISTFNQKFMVLPQKKRDLHRALIRKEQEGLDTIFAVQSIRRVNNDFTVRFKGAWYQLAETQPLLVMRKDKVGIEERIDGSLHMSLKGKYLDYIRLPERPKPVNVQLLALTRIKSSWKPPANHPWRTRFVPSLQKTKVSV